MRRAGPEEVIEESARVRKVVEVRPARARPARPESDRRQDLGAGDTVAPRRWGGEQELTGRGCRTGIGPTEFQGVETRNQVCPSSPKGEGPKNSRRRLDAGPISGPG